jgi:hypothetical protein
MSSLPRWECQTPDEAKAMIDWVNNELDRVKASADLWIRLGEELDDETKKWRSDGETPDWAVVMMVIERAVKKADAGDIEPLRNDLLHLTGHDLGKFLKRPKLKRGEHFPKVEKDPVAEAATAVKIIRKVWRRSFGKVNRLKGDKVSAEQIAADRFGVPVETIINKLKK